MSTLLRNSLWITPLLIAVSTITTKAVAITPVTEDVKQKKEAISSVNNQDTNSEIEQVISVSQLSDVQPTDWAFQALQSLVERYGCIAGYPNGAFRGNRAMTRYEFAAGLNACLNRVQELIATSTTDVVNKEDKKGNLAGIIFGQPPKVTSNDFGKRAFLLTDINSNDKRF
ncbi:S-layer homology domain-containing protein [Anabaena lutea FACHB-196]|uniref:S-layer homology domain-containing protein n=1 Tax=Anabaena lutea FACHB-196 TaxID=2692881 RepID=A0ABR8FCF3_9NOST|nr:S-layer homology domain-containing protein [Anabaena lutea FACHB-196]